MSLWEMQCLGKKGEELSWFVFVKFCRLSSFCNCFILIYLTLLGWNGGVTCGWVEDCFFVFLCFFFTEFLFFCLVFCFWWLWVGEIWFSSPTFKKFLCTLAVEIRIRTFGEALKYYLITISFFLGKQTKKRRRILAPMWWRWSRRSFLFHMLNGHLRVKSKWLFWAELEVQEYLLVNQHFVYSILIPDKYIFWLTL